MRPAAPWRAAAPGRRPLRRLLLAGAMLIMLGSLATPVVAGVLAGPVGAAPAQSPAPAGDRDVVSVFTASGLVDPVLARYLSDSIDQANRIGATALVWQLDSEGAVISDAELAALVSKMSRSAVPVNIWIGPSGSQLTGRSAYLLFGAASVGMAPGTTIGDVPLPSPLAGTSGEITVRNRVLVDKKLLDSPGRTFGTQEAQDLGITALPAPVIGDFIVNLPGVKTTEKTVNGQTRREPVTTVVFDQLPLGAQLMHTVASPPVAYLLFTIGMALFVFELFTAGVGVAGLVGAGSFVLACYGLAWLPVRAWAVAFLVLSMIAFAVDVQTGVPRLWTGIGVALYVVGSLALFDGVPMSWIALVAGIGGVLLTFLSGMPSMVRTRFSTPTIGREWMVGEMGRAVTDINPDGVVQIQGAQWRAYTNRATPIEQLDRVRVIGIEGLVLEVEPEEGAARDYRERRPRDSGADEG